MKKEKIDTRRIKKGIALALSLAMCFSLMSMSFAYDAPEDSGSLDEITCINPLYGNTVTEDDLIDPSMVPAVMSADNEEYTDIPGAADFVREKMINRENSITVHIKTDTLETYGDQVREVINEAVEHTGVPNEGDYLAWQYAGWTTTINYFKNNGQYYLTVKYTITYYTTAAQEKQVDTVLDSVLSDIISDNMTDYEKVCAIYHYLCCNIEYDHAHHDDTSYKTQFTAYGALINGTSVCQGYAVLFYRMALECGIDARVITGTEYSTNEAHGWNIVKLDGKYYNLDATWDTTVYESRGKYEYFLESDSSFYEHSRNSAYSNTEFNAAYPMANNDYSGEYIYHVMKLSDDFASCVNNGTANYTCAVCGATETKTVSENEAHTWDNGKVTTKATCTTDGIITYTCTVCGATKAESIEATGHDWAETELIAASCTTDGYEIDRCRNCGETKTATIPAEHNWNSGIVTVEPNCSTEGEMLYTCLSCGEEKTEIIEATLNHVWNGGETVLEATCGEEGLIIHSCLVCGIEDDEIISPTEEHRWDDGVITKEASCGEGTLTYTCTVCGLTKEESVSAVDGTEHVWDDGEVIKEATCTDHGEIRYICTVCSEHKLEPIEATGHNIVHVEATEATDETEGNIEYWYCENCGKCFADEELTLEITFEDTIIPMLSAEDSEGEEKTSENNQETDKSQLETDIENAEAFDSDDFTEESLEALMEALLNAKAVDEDKNATQEEIDAADAALKEAIAALEATDSTDSDELSDEEEVFEEEEKEEDEDDEDIENTDIVRTSDVNNIMFCLMFMILTVFVISVVIISKKKVRK